MHHFQTHKMTNRKNMRFWRYYIPVIATPKTIVHMFRFPTIPHHFGSSYKNKYDYMMIFHLIMDDEYLVKYH